MAQGGKIQRKEKVEQVVKKNKQKKVQTNKIIKQQLTSKVSSSIEKQMLDKIRKDGKVLRIIGRNEEKKEEKKETKKVVKKKDVKKKK